MKRLMVSILISCLATLQFNGETVNRVVSVFFRNGVDKVEMDYRDNADRFVMLDSIFATINADTTLTLSKIELAGWASPPASVEYNIE